MEALKSSQLDHQDLNSFSQYNHKYHESIFNTLFDLISMLQSPSINNWSQTNCLLFLIYCLNTIIYDAKPVLLKMMVSNSSNSSAW